MPKCPICEAPVKPRSENTSFPFCTSRCKTIDLGKWVNEEYRIAAPLTDEGEQGAGGDDEASKPGTPVRH